MKPQIACEHCGKPVDREEPMRGVDYWPNEDGTWRAILYVFYACSEPLDLYRINAEGQQYYEPGAHTWGKMKVMAYDIPADRVPDHDRARVEQEIKGTAS